MTETKPTSGEWTKSKTAYGWDICSGDIWIGTVHNDHCDEGGPRPGFPGNIEGEANANSIISIPTLQAKIEQLEADLGRATALLKEWSQAYKA